MRVLDTSTWNRREHFEFFSRFDEPFFGLVSEVDCTLAYNYCKAHKISFFAYYLHLSLSAVNEVEEFLYRIENDRVIIYDEVHASATIGRSDGTFGFSFIPYHRDFSTFQKELDLEIDAVQASSGLRLNDKAKRLDTIHFSSFPWNKFTGLSHARDFKSSDSCPKITVGKLYDEGDKKMMAVSINAHHGLVDGLHASAFLNKFQELLVQK